MRQNTSEATEDILLGFSKYLHKYQYNPDPKFDRNLILVSTDAQRIQVRHTHGMLSVDLARIREHLNVVYRCLDMDARNGGFRNLLKRRQFLTVLDELELAYSVCNSMGNLIESSDGGRSSARAAAFLMERNIRTLAAAMCSMYYLGPSKADYVDARNRIYTLLLLVKRAEKRANRAADDFISADLSGAQLGGINLGGLKWSEATVWPPGWSDRLRRASTESEPGIFVVTIDGNGSVNRLEEV
ncbi:hypothetical protein [Streptomyces antibioticus]|uniref:hypothetical protein n=1 Tax=Streptomyces antibioticus TaxID=1890 RepID=UPI003D735977